MCFFNLPAEKRKARRDEANPQGYYGTEHAKNVRDWKEVFNFVVEDPTFIPSAHLLVGFVPTKLD